MRENKMIRNPWIATSLTAIVVTFACINAKAVSRVGNRISEERTGFSAPIPSQFCLDGACRVKETRTSKLFLEDAQGISYVPQPGLPPMTLRLTVGDFGKEATALAPLGRKDLIDELTKNGWTRVATSSSCIESWLIENQGAFNVIAVWGIGKGITAYGLDVDSLKKSALELVQRIDLSPEACAW
jgi:hypothetical protein